MRIKMRGPAIALLAVAAMALPLALTDCTTSLSSAKISTTASNIPAGLEKIQHFVFIMEENKSFDHYFGTYPGADGFNPNTALKDPTDGTMVQLYHSTDDVDFDAPHDRSNALADIDGGKMDGFLNEAWKRYALSVTPSMAPGYNPKEVMSYHDYREIPNYWNYAHLYSLQDEMFSSVAAYSLSVHLYMVAAQSGGYTGETQPYPQRFDFPEITELLKNQNITWNYYVTSGNDTDANGQAIEPQALQATNPNNYTLWNPLPAFPKVENDSSQRVRMVDTAQFYKDAASGTLPSGKLGLPLPGQSVKRPSGFQGRDEETHGLCYRAH